jgi:hypothetical protein
VKGFPVETITTRVGFVDHPSKLPLVSASELHGVYIAAADVSTNKGTRELEAFLREEGPDFQLVRGGVYSVTLYSIKSDPRRKKQRQLIKEMLLTES